MLKIGSVHDYADVYKGGRLERTLSERELARMAEVEGEAARRVWALRRLLLKDLAADYLSLHHKRYFPQNTIDVRRVAGTGYYAVYCLMEDPDEIALYAWVSSVDDLAVGYVQPPTHESLRCGLQVMRVERHYPFMVDHRFSESEEAFLRGHSDLDLDEETTRHIMVKSLCADLLPETGTAEDFTVGRVDGDDRVHMEHIATPLPEPLDQEFIQTWSWEDHVIALAIFYTAADMPEGYNPRDQLSWV